MKGSPGFIAELKIPVAPVVLWSTFYSKGEMKLMLDNKCHSAEEQ